MPSKQVLIQTVAELSLQLGREIKPANNVAELTQQVADLKAEADTLPEAEQTPEADTLPEAEQTPEADTLPEAEQTPEAEKTCKVKAVKRVWTAYSGTVYKLKVGQCATWPVALARQLADDFVNIID